MKRTIVALIVVGGAIGFFVGRGPGRSRPAARVRASLSPEVYAVPVGAAPTRGGKQPKVTIIEFGDFRSPYATAAAAALSAIVERHGDDVLVAFKHYPVDRFDPKAALAAEAAREQGRFWPMHDRLSSDWQHLDRASLERHAQALGLDVAAFRSALDGRKHLDRIAADFREGRAFGVTGSPTYFINGRRLSGTPPLAALEALVEGEIANADARLKAGVARGALYAALTAGGATRDAVAAARPFDDPEAPKRVELGNAPSRGAGADALVTIVEFSDFQCPYCARVQPEVQRLLKEYEGKVRLVWKDVPLPFHANARPAAAVARVAAAQGKFWPMHDALFARGGRLDRAAIEDIARGLGLDRKSVAAALDDPSIYRKEIDADVEQSRSLRVSGTPAFFINGVLLSGAQPFEAFKERIDDALAGAQALIAAGTPRDKIYEVISQRAGRRTPL